MKTIAIDKKKPSATSLLAAQRKARIKRARGEMKEAVVRELNRVYPNFKADVWGEVKLEGDVKTAGKPDDWVDLIVAGYDGPHERRTFLVAVSLTHMFAPYIMRIEEAKSLWKSGY